MEHSAKYERIHAWITESISEGRFLPGDKLPSENELAEQFGFSRQTIRHATNELEAAGILTRKRGSGTYVARTTDGSLPKKTMRIGVITTYLDDYIFPGIIHGMEEILTASGYTMSLGITHNRQADEEICLQQMLANGVDGLIVEGTKSALPNPNLSFYKAIRAKGIPIVFINGYYSGICENSVLLDDVKAGMMLAKHLIHRGHTHIGGIFKSDDLQGLKRFEGMQRAFKEKGIRAEDHQVFWYTTEDLDYLFSGDMDRILINRFQDTTAVICYNDQIAAELLRLFSKQGIRVPEHKSIVSFDNSLLAEELACNLTSIVYPAKEIGQTAARTILACLKDAGHKEQTFLEPRIAYRASVKDIRNSF